MKKLKITILPGDGIGQEVMAAAMPIFDLLDIPTEITTGDIGWQCWQQEGNPIPARTWDLIKQADAVLLGATTSKPEKEAYKELAEVLQASRPPYVSPIIQLRQQLDLYANIRPCYNIKDSGEPFRFTVIRENTEGLYAGLDYYPLTPDLHSVIKDSPRWQHLTDPQDAACSLRLQSRVGLKRLFEFAFEHAQHESFHRVTFADKPNVLRKSSAFAREIFEEVAAKYPNIKADIHNVDAVALWMVKRPSEFGVIVAENMFGDILSDLGAGVMGGLGLAASANIGAKGCYFEPVHGSAPNMKPNRANPSAMFLTIALMLKHFGYNENAKQITTAVQQVIKQEKSLTYDLGGNASTQEMAQAILEKFVKPEVTKQISLVATGSEITTGDIQDSNSPRFAHQINELGGNIYQHLQVSDQKNEIMTALRYALNKSDAVIVTGGLGPTSDDVTRFAIADVIHAELQFNETAWQHVVHRLEKFNLVVTDANKQQALFPLAADLYPNANGTAYGCHLVWQNKHIFMLPGPPKECQPMFNDYVLKTLTAEGFFHKKPAYRFLTLGLMEGEIAPEIDAIAQSFSGSASYRWCYPYLEIKLSCPEKTALDALVLAARERLSHHIVSSDGKNAFEALV